MKWLKKLEAKLQEITPEEIKALGDELPKAGRKDKVIGELPDNLKPLAVYVSRLRQKAIEMREDFFLKTGKEGHHPDATGRCETCKRFEKEQKAIMKEIELVSDMLWFMVFDELALEPEADCIGISKGFAVIETTSSDRGNVIAIGIAPSSLERLFEMLSEDDR
ncbi:MAG: hypothetical protein PHG66_05145 [Candidatus Colwellbacteria bacterium]|nr:hypothetical protein [Candidatus Colwellbacteria bacterium]